MRWLLLLAIGLSACGVQPKNESEITKEQGIKLPEDVTAKTSYDGPFGIGKGQPLAALGGGQEVTPGMYAVKSPPKPYPNIETYLVLNTPQHGTCAIVVYSKKTESDSFGSAIRGAVDQVRDDISVRYGKPTESLVSSKNVRQYSYYWTAPKNPDPKVWRDVEGIAVSADSDGQKVWFFIMYEFSGSDKCRNDLRRKAANSL